MKKYYNYSIAYAIFAMVAGVFYREFTKFNGFSGVTALGKTHGHLFLLGMVVFLLIGFFSEQHELSNQKTFKIFMILYNLGLPLSATMFVVRGVPQVLNITLSSGMNAAISGMAGIGHILTGVGLILLLVSIRNTATK